MVAFAAPTGLSMLIGGILVLAGELLRFWGVAYAGSLTRVTGGVGAPEVIVAGPYAYVRNPLYMGNIALYIGVGVMANALAPWLVLAALVYFAFQYVLIVSLEEEFLTKQFGDAYLEYQRNVPRFIPRLSRYVHLSQERQQASLSEGLKSEKRTLQALGLVLLILFAIWLRG
jgi:protein-S-isoprenylcysteine O-methyltransferase Ste14